MLVYQSELNLSHLLQPESTLTEKQRCNLPHSLEYYTYANYLAYVLFPPLYIAGPILTFNNFVWQVLCSPSVVASQFNSVIFAAAPTSGYSTTDTHELPDAIPHQPSDHGSHTPLHVHGRNQRHKSLAG